MQWSEVIKPPSAKTLRQFAGLFLVFFLGLAAWRWFTGRQDTWALGMGIAALVVGLAGMAVPALVRPIYTGWMIAAFPIGWTVSRLILATVFFLVVTPIALVFRAIGRDALVLRRRKATTYWMTKARSQSSADYLRQS